MLLSTLLWTALELIGGVVPHNYQGLLVVWVRYASHLAFMLIVFGPRYRFDLVRTQALKLQLFRPVFMIGMPLFFLVGLRFMPVTNIWSAFWLAPFMTMILASILFKERVSVWQWLTTLIGLFGAIAIYQPKAGFLNWTLIFPLGMAFCFSGYLVLTRALRTERTLTNLFYTALIVFLPWSLGFFYFWRPLNLSAFYAMTAIGILGILVVVLSRQGICACACFCGDTFSLWTTDFHGDPWLFSIWKHSLQHGNSRWCIPDHGPRLLDLA